MSEREGLVARGDILIQNVQATQLGRQFIAGAIGQAEIDDHGREVSRSCAIVFERFSAAGGLCGFESRVLEHIDSEHPDQDFVLHDQHATCRSGGNTMVVCH